MSVRAPGRGRGRGDRRRSTEPPAPGRGASPQISRRPDGAGQHVGQVTREIEEHETSSVDNVSPETAPAVEASSRMELSSCDTLLISNLPENANEFLIEMYFENPKSGGCEGAIEKIHFVEPKVAQIQFKDPQVAKSILSKPSHMLQGSELTVQYYSARDKSEDAVSAVPETGSLDTLEVRNLPHNVSTDALQLYFESPKSGGCADGVKDIALVESGVARVQLTDAMVAANILEKSLHTFAGATLDVRPFEPLVEDNTLKDTLEISNLPQECDEETMQLYFENPKSGGRPSGVKNIEIIGDGVARVQFVDDLTAGGVLAKEEHKFYGAKLQVKYYDSSCTEECLPKDTLQISNLPPDIHADTLELYLESRKSGGCAGGVKSITFVSPGIARVQFNSETTADSILKKDVHKFQGKVLEVKVYAPSVETGPEEVPLDTLEVSNLPSSVTEDVLELYFESPKSGGHGGAVKDISFSSPGVARVKFSDPQTADEVVKRVHKLQDVELQVRFLQESARKPADTLEVSGLPEGISEDLIELYFENAKSGGCAGAIKSISFIGPTTACVQCASDKVAAGILAKEEHRLKGSVLQVRYFDSDGEKVETDQLGDTLEVRNFPASVSKDLVELYFENPKSGGCDGAVKSVSITGPGVAQVRFSSPTIAAKVMAKRPQKFKGLELDMKYSKTDQESSSVELSDDTLQVSNLPENVSKEYLEFYFESPKSGGCPDGVKNVTLIRPGMAKVLFSSSKVAASVVAKEDHRFEGSPLQVEYIKLSGDQNGAQEGGATLEVSNIPLNMKEDYLRMYFENPKSGGCADCVEDVAVIEPGIAHVQLIDATIAASICSRKVHKVGQAELQVKCLPTPPPVAYEMDKLILENVPEDVEEEYLTLFIVNCLGILEDDFSATRSNDKVLLVLSKEYPLPELQTIIKNLQARPIKKGAATLRVTLYEVCRSIRIHSITEHYDKDYISMYFETTSKRSGGSSVESIQMLGEGEVIITFKDHKVVSAALERAHPSFGPHVKVERKDSLHSSAVPRENISSVDIAVDPIIVKCISKRPEQLKQLVRDLHVELKFDGDNGKVVCFSTIHTKAGWKEVATTSVGSYIDSNYISIPDQWVPKDAQGELYGHLANQKGLVFEVSKDGTILKIGGEKKVVQSLEGTLKDIFDRYTVDTAEVRFDQDPETFHFLTQVKLPQMSDQLTYIQISKDPHIPSLTLRGVKKDVVQFQSELPKIGIHSRVTIRLQPHVMSYLRTQDGQCQLQNYLSQAKVQAAPYFTSQGMQTLLCESAHVDTVKGITANLATVMSVVERKIPSSFEAEQENYLQLCQTCEKQHHVKVSHAGKVLVVAGMTSGVDTCIAELYKFIQSSCTVEEHISIERGELRLLLSHMKPKWDTIVKSCESSEFVVVLSVPQLRPNDDESISRIQLSGERDCVKRISSQITKLQGTICKQSDMIEQADIEFLTSEKARTYLDGIEFRERVIIEVALPVSSPTPTLAHTVGTKHYLKCRAKLNEMSTFYLYIGDISEFNGADVIVNAANIELKHIGGVALALLQKGGPIIQEESTRYIRSHGKLKPGDAWLTTKVGSLPCKALVHTAGPKWSGNYHKDSRILENACMQSLQKSAQQKYRSIAFPTISAGIYGFPIDKCAVCMVKTILKFSQAPSDLKDIIVVIHTSKSADAEFFLSALKQHLPPDSIHVNDEQASMAQKHSKAETMPPGASKSAKKKKSTKKSHSTMPSAAVSKVPPGVLDCIKLVKGIEPS